MRSVPHARNCRTMSQGAQQTQTAAPVAAPPQPKAQPTERLFEQEAAGAETGATATLSRMGNPAAGLQRAVGNQAVARMVGSGITVARRTVMPKLRVNAPNDIFEQEADRVADAVMNMPATPATEAAGPGPQAVQRMVGAGGIIPVQKKCSSCEAEQKRELQRKPMPALAGRAIMRKCSECEKKEKEIQRKPATGSISIAPAPFAPAIQRDAPLDENPQLVDSIKERESEGETPVARKGNDSGVPEPGASFEAQLAGSRGSGSPMPAETRSFFEERIGADFSGVRVHADASAARMAGQINARAFTHGSDVYFGAGQYSPGTDDGRRLLAHELTHTVQQAGAAPPIQRDEPKDTPTKKKRDLRTFEVKVTSRDYNNPKLYMVTATMQVFNLTEAESAAFVQLHGLEWDDPTFTGPKPGDTIRHVAVPVSLLTARQADIDALKKKPGGIVKEAWDKRQQTGGTGGPEPGWDTRKMEFAPGMGAVQVEKGTELRTEATKPGGPILPFSTMLIVVKEVGDYYFISTDDGQFGYVLKKHVDMRVPEPKAKLHWIKSGETATHIVKKYYGNFNTWGADQRLYVNVLLYVNKMAGRTEGIKGYDYQTAYTYANHAIWVPSTEFALYLRDRKDITSGSLSYDVYQAFLDATIGPPVFLAGLIHGALESLWDALVGIVELFGMAWDILKALFTGTLGSKASELWKQISSLDVGKLIEHGIDVLDQKWNDPSLLKRWHYRGWLTGYIVMEVITLFFTDGLIEGVKVVAQSAKVAKFVEAIPILKEVVDLAKAMKAEGKAAKFIDALKADKTIAGALEKLHMLRTWAKNMLALPAEILADLAADALERLQKLGSWAMERLRTLAKRGDLKALRECLGCASPCKVDIEAILKYLEKANKEGKLGTKLTTKEEVLAALPKAMDTAKIAEYLDSHPALMALIKEAGLTELDFGPLAEQLATVSKMGKGDAYRSFTQYLTRIIPAKTGPDVERFNAIIDAMMLADPRQGSALKGSMFEMFNSMHVKGFEGLPTQVPFKIPPPANKAAREADYFDRGAGAIWDAKHSPRPPGDQFDDYVKLLGTTQNGAKIESINYLFAKEEWALEWIRLNPDKAKTPGVKIFFLANDSKEVSTATKLIPKQIPVP